MVGRFRVIVLNFGDGKHGFCAKKKSEIFRQDFQFSENTPHTSTSYSRHAYLKMSEKNEKQIFFSLKISGLIGKKSLDIFYGVRFQSPKKTSGTIKALSSPIAVHLNSTIHKKTIQRANKKRRLEKALIIAPPQQPTSIVPL